MSRFAYNDIFKEQAQRILPSTYRRAIVVSVNSSMGTIDVSFSDNPQSVIRNVMASSAIDLTKILVGDKCRVDIFDEKNARDMVVAYAYGRAF